MRSIFIDKIKRPADADLKKALSTTYPYWKEIENFATTLYPNAKAEWHFSGIKYGWSYRISDKKRVIVYLLPRDQYFKVAIVFGAKATDEVFNSNVSDEIKNELHNAKPYAEGRGIRIAVVNETIIEDIRQLIAIKVKY